MRKFLIFCVAMSLIFLFTIPTLATDINKIDLKSNLSFTFEPLTTTEKSLTIIPFSDLDLSLIQEKSAEEVKKSDSSLVGWCFAVWLTAFVIAATS